jgi:hypothetical protein
MLAALADMSAERADTLAEPADFPVAAVTSRPVVDSTAVVAAASTVVGEAASTVVEAVPTAAADTAKPNEVANGYPLR